MNVFYKIVELSQVIANIKENINNGNNLFFILIVVLLTLLMVSSNVSSVNEHGISLDFFLLPIFFIE